MISIHDSIRRKMRAHRDFFNTFDGRGQWIGVRGDRQCLAELYCELGYTEGVEVGTQRGHHAQRLCNSNPKLHLTCVDPWSSFGSPGQSRHNRNYANCVNRLKPYNVTIIRSTSMDAVHSFKDRSLDFVFIDGDHRFDYVCSDLIFWSPKVKHGGIIACHDYSHWYEVGVMQAVDAYTYCHDIRPLYINFEPSPTAFWVNP